MPTSCEARRPTAWAGQLSSANENDVGKRRPRGRRLVPVPHVLEVAETAVVSEDDDVVGQLLAGSFDSPLNGQDSPVEAVWRGNVIRNFKLYGWAAATAVSYDDSRRGLDPQGLGPWEISTQDQVDDATLGRPERAGLLRRHNASMEGQAVERGDLRAWRNVALSGGSRRRSETGHNQGPQWKGRHKPADLGAASFAQPASSSDGAEIAMPLPVPRRRQPR